MNIESKGYEATPAQIGELTKEILTASGAVESGHGTYFRSLIRMTQKDLGVPERKHKTKGGQMKPQTKEEHLKALESVQARFYKAVLLAAGEIVPKGAELNSKTNFARSAYSTLRTWIKAGNDVTSVVASRAVKSAFYVQSQPRPHSAKRLLGRVERQSKALMSSVLALVDTDPQAAVDELQLLVDQLNARIAEIAVVPGRAAEPAPQERRVFIRPTATGVLRQRAQPS